MKNLKTNTIIKQVIFFFLFLAFIQPTFAEEPNTNKEDNAISATLSSFYKSEKGALIYVRQEGTKVYWLAERFDRKFVAVFKGNYRGNQISGSYYNLPKGRERGSGSLKIEVKKGGRILKVTGGNMDGQVLTAIVRPTKFPARWSVYL